MRYRTLGSTGLEISEIAFGCGPTAGLMVRGERAERVAAVARALELGVTYFDTAPVYGSGQSELHLGEALREIGARPVVASKVALDLDELDEIPVAVMRSVEGSLGRLQRDSIDILHLHNRVGSARAAHPDIGSGALVTVDDILRADAILESFERLRADGKVRFLGCCAFGGSMACVREVMSARRFDAILVQYSLLNPSAAGPCQPALDRKDYEGVMLKAAELGMGVSVIRALEAGLLTGTPPHPLATTRTQDSPSMDTLALERLSQRLQMSPAQLALRFVLSRPEVSTVVVGFSAEQHLLEAAGASDAGPLAADALAELSRWASSQHAL